MTDMSDVVKMTAGEQLAWLGVDAQRWTQFFLHTADLSNAGPDFQGTVLTWFANALEAGRGEGTHDAMKRVREAGERLELDFSEVYIPDYAIEVAYKTAWGRALEEARQVQLNQKKPRE